MASHAKDSVRSCPRAGCGKSACPVVCPAKAGMFSRRKACRGKNQRPRSLDSRVAGNQDPEAYRQRLPWGGDESPGRNNSERKSGLENEWPRRPSPQPEGEGSMGSRNLIDAAPTLRRGGSDSTVTRTCRATGEALLVPARNRRSRVGRITGETGKSAEDERVAAGSAVAMKRSNVRGAKGPCHLQRLRRKEGKDEMTKASIDLQDLRRRIYVKVKAELLRRFWINTFVCSGAKGPRLGTMD